MKPARGTTGRPHALGRDRWLAASPYLDRALDLASDARNAWLASLRAENPVLAADVDALLERHARLSAIELERRRLGDDPRDAAEGSMSSRLGRAHLLRGRVLAALGQTREAAAALNTALAHLTTTVGADHPHTRLARQLASTARP